MQTDFAKGLLDPSRPAPEGVVDPAGRPAGKRYDVYRNNVVVSLIEALAAAYPVIQKLVGDEFFAAMAGVHVRAHPPKSPLMIQYGADFPHFLADFPPLAHLPYLGDVARLERARRRVYHAADATSLTAETLAKRDSLALLDTRLVLHPALAVVCSQHPVLTIWRKNMNEPELPLPANGECVLISRPADSLQMQGISPASRIFIEALENAPLGQAIEAALHADPAFDPGANLAAILSAGLITDLQ